MQQKLRALIATVELTKDKVGLETLKELLEEAKKTSYKAKKYDEIVNMMDKIYTDDSNSDLCDIGLKLAKQMGYI